MTLVRKTNSNTIIQWHCSQFSNKIILYENLYGMHFKISINSCRHPHRCAPTTHSYKMIGCKSSMELFNIIDNHFDSTKCKQIRTVWSKQWVFFSFLRQWISLMWSQCSDRNAVVFFFIRLLFFSSIIGAL